MITVEALTKKLEELQKSKEQLQALYQQCLGQEVLLQSLLKECKEEKN